jgi:sugar lactone lactonase YvrE
MQSILQRISSTFILVLIATCAFAQAPVVSPLAGTGAAGYSGDGGQATSADLNSPSEVAVDSKGNIYIADLDNNRIRRVTNGSGIIDTFAGNGTTGYFYLEGGPATGSVLNHPFGAAVDIAGNVYIADFGGWSTVGFTNLYIVSDQNSGVSRIHRVDITNNTINQIQLPTTLNGTLALAVDKTGNLYIAERFGQKIYRLTIQSGAFSVIGGNGSAGFSGDGGPGINAQIHNPGYLAVDAAGNIYFSDSLNNRIRKIAAGSDIITTVAGNGTAGFSGDGGPATAAALNNPEGVAVDAQGNIYIADTANRRIRRVNTNTGVITTLISAQSSGDCQAVLAGLQSPGSLTLNDAGDMLFITDNDANMVWQATLNPVKTPPTLKAIAPPNGAPGATISVTLTGSGFNAGAAAGACQNSSVVTMSISGAGVTASNINVTSDTSMTADLVIASNAALGSRNVTVATDGGVSGPVPFNIVVPVAPPPTLTSITPASAVEGTSATITLVGTNFDTKAGNTSVSIDGSGISATQVSVAGATSLTAVFNIAANAALGNHNVRVATGGGSSNAVAFNVLPAGPAFTYGIPPMLNPTDQTPIQVGLASASPNTVTGTLTLTFAPNATSPTDDPNVTFVNAQTNTRTATVTFPPNTTTAQLSLPDGVLQAGTEAGTIQLSMSGVQVAGVATTPAGTNFNVQIPLLPPVITNIRIFNRSSAGFDVEITGYSTSREITAATFDFGAASGAKLLTVELQPDVSSSFTGYYQSGASGTVGGAFVYTQPFIAQQGDANVVASVTATLTNSQGTSQPKTAP